MKRPDHWLAIQPIFNPMETNNNRPTGGSLARHGWFVMRDYRVLWTVPERGGGLLTEKPKQTIAIVRVSVFRSDQLWLDQRRLGSLGRC